MNAKTCDRCGVLWYDRDECEVNILIVSIRQEDSNRDNSYDLCEDCIQGLYQYVAPIVDICEDIKKKQIQTNK